jgi:hypothetical protein
MGAMSASGQQQSLSKLEILTPERLVLAVKRTLTTQCQGLYLGAHQSVKH